MNSKESISQHFEEHFEEHIQEELDRDKMYPNRHKEIHKVCCKKCPSKYCSDNGIVDLEDEEYKGAPKEFLMKEVLFLCAWRPSKLCKGLCDNHNINQQDLDNYHKNDLP